MSLDCTPIPLNTESIMDKNQQFPVKKIRVTLIIQLFLGVLLLFIPSTSMAQGGSWTSKKNMPTIRLGLSTAVVGGKIYAIGGVKYHSNRAISNVEVYDPESDTWEARANMPTARWGLTTAVVDGIIYAIGGVTAIYTSNDQFLGVVEAYDPATDTWTKKRNMPSPRGELVSGVVNGKIYVIGGGGGLTRVGRYDPQTNSWSTKASLPEPRSAAGAAAVDGVIYVVAGQKGFGGGFKTVFAYNAATNKWTRKNDMPFGTVKFATCSSNGLIYIIGGGPNDPTDPVYSIVQVYDTQTDSWSYRANMPTSRLWQSANIVNDRLYAIGGSTTWTLRGIG